MTNQEMQILPPLWQHQKLAIERAGSRFALFFDPGCGKSRTAIELLKKNCARLSLHPHSYRNAIVRENISIKKIIIFAPLNVCRNWENELKEYLGHPYKTFLVSGQTKLKKIKIIQEFSECFENKHLFLICNIEVTRSEDYLVLLKKCGATFVIVDESHNFKTPNSRQTKGLLEIDAALKPEFLYLLTGTPAPQGEIDLWSTFYLLKKTKDSFFIWRKKNFEDKNERRRGMNNYWPEYIIRPQAKVQLQAMLADCSVTAKKNEVLDLPPLLRTKIYAPMSPEQKRHYETMKEFLFAIDGEGNELNASNLLSRTLRLQQILAGFLGEVPIKDNPRLEALDLAIEKTNGEQFIIWTIFRATYDQLCKILEAKGIEHGHLTGDIIPEARQENMDRFQAGAYRALIAHPRAGGVGVNLTAASYSIHYTRSYSLVDDLQCEARNYRGGSERHDRITRVDIITPDSIDEEIQAALKKKKSVQDFILGLKEKYEKVEAA